ncbi:MAG: hypothetical protein NZ805_07065 [Armatimonadetes bacterium]|nr:hypothetical protein [Armatimonadota bacterium]MDW8029776.1 hypothetical protein [Armatimonadota bacterium]
MELEYFCDGSVLEKNPFVFRYPRIGSITVNSSVYDEDFVIESFTSDGRCLLRAKEVFEMVARSLLVDIGSPVGAKVRSANANISTVLEMERCPQTNKRRFIHSLGATAVAIPVQELLKRGALKILKQFLQDKALGSAIPASELENEVNAFLQANRLDERGERNDLLEALLRRGDSEQVSYALTRTREELEREAGGSEVQQAQYVANWVDSELNRIRTEVVPEAQSIVNERKIEVLQTAVGSVVGRLETLTKTKGLRAAQSFIGQLIVVFETVCDDLVNEQKKYETEQKPALENTINNQVAFLRSLQGVWGSIKALGRVDEQAMDIALQTLREYGNAKILHIARQAAIELIGSEQPIDGHPSLLKQLQTWQQQIERAIVKVSDLVRQSTQEISHRTQITPTGSTYTLEQWVIDPSEFDDWLKRMGIIETEYDANSLWQALGDNLEQWLKTLTELKAEDLLDELAKQLVDPLSQKLQGWDILRVIEEESKTEKKKHIDVILQTMMQVCQPFWSAPRHAPGGVAYQTFLAYTVPTAEGDEHYQQAKRAIERLAQNFGYQPETVHNGYPFALEMVVRVYGARAFYLSSTQQLRYQYEQKRQNPETAQLLHLDRRFLKLLPILHEHEKTQS